MTDVERWLLVSPSSELYTKSRRTEDRFRRILLANMRDGLARARCDADVSEDRRRRIVVRTAEPERAAEALCRILGVQRVVEAAPVPEPALDELSDLVADFARERVAGHRFAVRVGRRGGQPWRVRDAESAIGARLFDASAGVDLENPEVTVRVEAYGDYAWIVQRVWDGPAGLPLGTQEPCLAMVSGGFDSAVAAWQVMSRGCPTEFVHFQLDCAQSDHALAVLQELWHGWGAGTDPHVWLLDFQPVKEALFAHVPSAQRQVVLKQLMTEAADRLADHEGIPALVTGEALGQVSSQTLSNLAAIDRSSSRAVLRPLLGMGKQDIIAESRRIGTHDLSARAREVCDLAGGRVMVTADRPKLEQARRLLPSELIDDAFASRRGIAVSEWFPGMPGVAVVDTPPADAEAVWVDEGGDPRGEVPETDPVALAGPGGLRLACRLQAQGRDVCLVARRAGAVVAA